jgi:formylglycine-generating enzyme required for sulfatase activity
MVSLNEIPDVTIAHSRWLIPDLELTVVPVEAGSFTMGSAASEAGRRDNEDRHAVTLRNDFWIGATEVTQKQWRTVMGFNPSKYPLLGDDAPVEQVSWKDAMEFCRKLTARERAAGRLRSGQEYRLPTEAQWEYAARAGRTSAFHGGSSLLNGSANVENDPNSADDRNLDNFNANRRPIASTWPVATLNPNAWGIYDMHGNVWEWCRDSYVENLGTSARTDPDNSSNSGLKVVRGGSWFHAERYARLASRSSYDNDFTAPYVGFRIVLVED